MNDASANEERLKLEPSWKAHIGHWFERPEMKALGEFLRTEKQSPCAWFGP